MTVDELISALQALKFERADYDDNIGSCQVFVRDGYAHADPVASIDFSNNSIYINPSI
jgi:hypothetical protein